MYHQHLDWKKHIKRLKKERQFDQMYRMRYASFCKLLSLLSPVLKVDQLQAQRRPRGSGPISEELILHCLIRYMAGGLFHDIRVNAGMAKSTFFSAIHRGIDAVNRCPELSINFPTSRHDLKVVALEYQNKSSNGVLDGCVRALDGWLCRVQVPTQKETANISVYFSGHYQCYGVNVQALLQIQLTP